MYYILNWLSYYEISFSVPENVGRYCSKKYNVIVIISDIIRYSPIIKFV